MTEISLAAGWWHSVWLAFVRLVNRLYQKTWKALSERVAISAVPPGWTNKPVSEFCLNLKKARNYITRPNKH